MKNQARIENWTEIPAFGGGSYLLGTIKDHPRQHMFHAAQQMTSPIIKMDRANGICETENTVYVLGKEAGVD